MCSSDLLFILWLRPSIREETDTAAINYTVSQNAPNSVVVSEIILNITQGSLLGKRLQTRDGRDYLAFLGKDHRDIILSRTSFYVQLVQAFHTPSRLLMSSDSNHLNLRTAGREFAMQLTSGQSARRMEGKEAGAELKDMRTACTSTSTRQR